MMASRTRPTPLGQAEPPTLPAPTPPTPHALYDLDEVEAALGREQRALFTGDPIDDGLGVRNAVLQGLVDAGEAGRWRTLSHPTPAAIETVQELTARAPHLRAVIDLVVRRLQAARAIGVPLALPPLLLLGPPGVGKSWLMKRLAWALGVPFRLFSMNLTTLGDTLSGNHPVWKSGAPGLVAKTLLREPVANPLILVDELDKPPPPHVGGDPYRPFYSLLEPEGARTFIDDHLGVPIDASRVLWVASANRIDEIPEPVIDRLTVVEVGAMAHEDRMAVLGSVYADLRASYRGYFDPIPTCDLLERLAGLAPRRAKLVLDDALMRAAADGRRTVAASDVMGKHPEPKATPATRRMH